MNILPEALTEKLSARLKKLLEDCDTADAAVVATADGRLCAMQQRATTYPLERLATMGSTLVSLADTITKEMKMGKCDNVIAENENGIITFMHISPSLVLVSVTTHKNSLGMMLRHSRTCAQDMAGML